MSKSASGMTFADIQKRHEELGQSDGLIAQIVGAPRPGAKILSISTALLHEKVNHTFKIRTETELFASLCESILANGIKTPLLVRPSRTEIGHFEILAGHTRLAAAKQIGLTEVPCIVEAADDADADQLMVETNLQRPDWLPSERAKSYKAWLEAVKAKSGIKAGGDRTGKQIFTECRFAPTTSQDGVSSGVSESDEQIFTGCRFAPESKNGHPISEFGDDPSSNEELAAKHFGIGAVMFHIYIKLNDLIPPLLDMLDENRINVKAGYQLSFLTSEQQERLLKLLEVYKSKKINEGMAKDLRYLGENEWERILGGTGKKKGKGLTVNFSKLTINADETEMATYMDDPELYEFLSDAVNAYLKKRRQVK